MSVRIINALKEDFWSCFADHSFCSVFSSRPWATALTQTYGFTIQAAVCRRRGNANGAILFSQVCDARGKRIVSLPFSDYSDPLTEDADTWDEAIGAVLGLNTPTSLRCLHNQIPVKDGRLTLVNQALWHGIDLSRNEKVLWAGLTGSARQNIRKAKRLGVVVRERSDLEGVQIFHAMHCHVRKSKYRLLAQPLAFFEALHQAFAPHGAITILLAEVDGAPIAGTLYLSWRGTQYYKFNASLDPRWYANDLLVWEGMRLGQRCGLIHFDFGLSDAQQPGLIRFKRKFATEERPIYFLRWQPSVTPDESADELGEALRRMTSLFTDPRVPDDITRAAGETLYRYFC